MGRTAASGARWMAVLMAAACAGCGGGLSGATGSPQPSVSSGIGAISGKVLRSPCPPHAQPVCAAPAMPLVATIKVMARGSSAAVAQSMTDAAGEFIIDVGPGQYSVVALPAKAAYKCPAVAVTVRAGAVATANVACT